MGGKTRKVALSYFAMSSISGINQWDWLALPALMLPRSNASPSASRTEPAETSSADKRVVCFFVKHSLTSPCWALWGVWILSQTEYQTANNCFFSEFQSISASTVKFSRKIHRRSGIQGWSSPCKKIKRAAMRSRPGRIVFHSPESPAYCCTLLKIRGEKPMAVSVFVFMQGCLANRAEWNPLFTWSLNHHICWVCKCRPS